MQRHRPALPACSTKFHLVMTVHSYIAPEPMRAARVHLMDANIARTVREQLRRGAVAFIA